MTGLQKPENSFWIIAAFTFVADVTRDANIGSQASGEGILGAEG
jgi:hypothetical protein